VDVTEYLEARRDAPIESSIPAGAVPLASILYTEELHRRPSRPPDHEEENRALVKLVSALADSPSTIFQTLAETIVQITKCDSAGLSLLTTDGQTPDVSGKSFYWPAIAGMWNPHVGGGTPRNFGPCGDVLDQNRTLLFKHFERRYPYLLPVIPAAEECLLVPFHVAGKAVGTIWAILHSDRRQFDAEDDRVMGSLGKFASSAYQALASIDELRFQIGEREKAEAALHRLADGLETQVRVRTRDLERSTHELLDSNKELEKEIAKRRRAEDRFRRSEARALGLADEQAALRRVATLVAQQPSPSEVFTAVTQAVGLLLGADLAALHVFPGDGTARTIASWSGDGGPILPIGSRFPLDGESVAARIFETAAPARIDSYAEAEGEAVDLARRLRVRSTVGAPILVQGELWGALNAATRGVEPWAENAETRIAAFTELVATAIANAESSAELAASRRRIVAASDDARRRIERDLHDGTQQRLVSLALAARAAEADVAPQERELRDKLSRIATGLGEAVEDLQELSRGIHPAILSDAGLAPALETLAMRSAIPVQLEVATEGRFPEPIEIAAYFVASEALANAAKHAHASCIDVLLAQREDRLLLSIRDDGVGGVDPSRGTGLVGLTDRVEALGGTIKVDSSAGSGTCVVVTLPIATEPDQEIENFLGPRQELGAPTSPA
jgi:signal transduction histidine kinase